jgi:hypothetical protein
MAPARRRNGAPRWDAPTGLGALNGTGREHARGAMSSMRPKSIDSYLLELKVFGR